MRFTEVDAHKSYAYSKDEVKQKPLFNIAEKIKRDCQPYLKQNKNAMISRSLYRGVKTGMDDPLTIQKSVRLDDRRSSDSDARVHDFFNKYFTEIYGAPFRNAMFASGSPGAASDYGDNVYIVFPIGEFQYLWSDVVDDLYSNTLVAGDDLEGPEELAPGTEMYNHLYHTFVTSYQTDEFEKAILSQHEIMIRVKSYYGIHKDVQYNTDLTNKLNKVMYS